MMSQGKLHRKMQYTKSYCFLQKCQAAARAILCPAVRSKAMVRADRNGRGIAAHLRCRSLISNSMSMTEGTRAQDGKGDSYWYSRQRHCRSPTRATASSAPSRIVRNAAVAMSCSPHFGLDMPLDKSRCMTGTSFLVTPMSRRFASCIAHNGA